LIIVLIAKYLLGFYVISAKFVMASAFVNLFVIVNVRLLLFVIFKKYRTRGYDLHRVLIYANAFSDEFVQKIIDQKEWGFQVVKIISNSRLIRAKFGNEIPVVSENTDIKKILDEEVIDELIYTKSVDDQEQIHNLVNLCNEVGVMFRMQSGISPLKTFKLQLNTLNNSNQLSLADSSNNSLSQFFKYLADLYFSFFMLIALSPLFLFLGILIKLTSKGPVFLSRKGLA
jgi:FlaA1/EpsC-like NDP-sugar epimerase